MSCKESSVWCTLAFLPDQAGPCLTRNLPPLGSQGDGACCPKGRQGVLSCVGLALPLCWITSSISSELDHTGQVWRLHCRGDNQSVSVLISGAPDIRLQPATFSRQPVRVVVHGTTMKMDLRFSLKGKGTPSALLAVAYSSQSTTLQINVYPHSNSVCVRRGSAAARGMSQPASSASHGGHPHLVAENTWSKTGVLQRQIAASVPPPTSATASVSEENSRPCGDCMPVADVPCAPSPPPATPLPNYLLSRYLDMKAEVDLSVLGGAMGLAQILSMTLKPSEQAP